MECKDLIQHRADHIAYFIDELGNSCDLGSKLLIECNKIPAQQRVEVHEIFAFKQSNGKQLIVLSVKAKDDFSQESVKQNLIELLKN